MYRRGISPERRLPDNMCTGIVLSGKRPVRESSCPGNVRIPGKWGTGGHTEYMKVASLKLTLTLTLTLSLNPKLTNFNGHRRPYRIHESGESKTDANLNSNPNQNTHPNLIPKP